ncbi:hypothetical protein [uncultured Lactobacillus sp.]|uniref:hypothetical protein n=1 Tax=uncultured Lactobacillus sp. TaxID=153152 RepID=UPI0025DFC5FD|nr:hypothetical protein [uncultured Lactobacillus sp.]
MALINRHGTAILDRPHTSYSITFKEQTIRRVLVKNEAIYQVALDLVLKNNPINLIIMPKMTSHPRRNVEHNVYSHQKLTEFLITAKKYNIRAYTYFKILSST